MKSSTTDTVVIRVNNKELTFAINEVYNVASALMSAEAGATDGTALGLMRSLYGTHERTVRTIQAMLDVDVQTAEEIARYGEFKDIDHAWTVYVKKLKEYSDSL